VIWLTLKDETGSVWIPGGSGSLLSKTEHLRAAQDMLKAMRILLVGNYEPDAQQSMSRYAEWLERTLKARGHAVTVARPQPFFSLLARRAALRKYLGYLDKFLLFPPKLRRLARAHDLVHVLDHSNSMYLRSARSTPSLVTCHDVLAIRAARGEFSQSPTGWSGRLLQRWILGGLRGARHVVCVSSKTASDLKHLTGETGAEIRVVYNPLNWGYRPGGVLSDKLVARLGLSAGESYLLHVGGNQWYKNRVGAIRIFARLAERQEFANLRLVLAGKPWTAEMRAAVAAEGLEGRVVEAVGLDNEELQALYGNALALLFPSLEEGFGWPVLEAQACGCPVITTGRPPMSEVAGDAAIFIDPEDPSSAAEKIAQGLGERGALREAGFRNLARFDETAIADQYSGFYAEIVGKQAL
jgi:glycosyltransferase involved in cell wall biosynthesis